MISINNILFKIIIKTRCCIWEDGRVCRVEKINDLKNLKNRDYKYIERTFLKVNIFICPFFSIGIEATTNQVMSHIQF